MKKQTVRKTIAHGLVGLVAALPGCVSEFNPMFRPNQVSSTAKQRGIFDLGQKIEGMIVGDKPFYLDSETHTLYVNAKDYHESLDKFKLNEKGTYDELYERNRIEIKYLDPNTGREVVEDQIVANDGTIDTPLGSFNAYKTRQKLDDEITLAARNKFSNPDMEVLVKQTNYPYAEEAAPFLGFITLINSQDAIINNIAAQPTNLQGALVAGGMGDTKYAIMIKNINNNEERKTDPELDYVRRVIVMGPTGSIVRGEYDKIKASHEDVVIGLGNRPLDNFQDFMGELFETFDVAGRATGAYMQTHSNLDLISNRNSYLPSRQNKTSRIGRFTNQTNAYSNALDASRNLQDKFKGN
ncbi:MAG: hypothetical protein AABY10_01215 [Nanoarchaeota archaeon]